MCVVIWIGKRGGRHSRTVEARDLRQGGSGEESLGRLHPGEQPILESGGAERAVSSGTGVGALGDKVEYPRHLTDFSLGEEAIVGQRSVQFGDELRWPWCRFAVYPVPLQLGHHRGVFGGNDPRSAEVDFRGGGDFFAGEGSTADPVSSL